MQILTDKSQKEQKNHGTHAFPFLVSKERLLAYESGSFFWHWHPEIEITIVTSGEMNYQVNNCHLHLKTGDALFGNSATLHSGSMYEYSDCEYTVITFDARLLYGYENSVLYHSYIKPVLQNYSLPCLHFDGSSSWHSEAISQLKQILNTYETQDMAWEFDVLEHLLHFWKLLYQHTDSSVALSVADQRNYERIRNILSYIENNYASKLTLEDIADHVHLCKSECCRMFKRYMRQSLFDFILAYRIEKSLPLLGDNNYSIQLISEKSGFSDSNYFSRVFKQLKGCSPTAFRKEILSHAPTR